MENNIEELFKQNFGFAFKAVTYNNMKVALQTFERFKRENEKFFSFDKRETLFGHLRTYAIEKQFNDSAFNPKSDYIVSMKQVNKYMYKTLCIETNDFIVNIGRTNNPRQLLPASSYRKEFAKANCGTDTQLSFEFMDNVLQVVDSKKYAEITYGYNLGDITHLQIIVPSSDYGKIEYSINILEDAQIYEGYVPEELVEESVVTLKESLNKKVEKAV